MSARHQISAQAIENQLREWGSGGDFPFIANEQIVDPLSGEIIALRHQLVSDEDLERISWIGETYDMSPAAYLDGFMFTCRWCGTQMRGCNIQLGETCECGQPCWIKEN